MKKLINYSIQCKVIPKYFMIFSNSVIDEMYSWEYASGFNSAHKHSCIQLKEEYPEFHNELKPLNDFASLHKSLSTVVPKGASRLVERLRIFEVYEETKQINEIVYLKDSYEIEQWLVRNT